MNANHWKFTHDKGWILYGLVEMHGFTEDWHHVGNNLYVLDLALEEFKGNYITLTNKRALRLCRDGKVEST